MKKYLVDNGIKEESIIMEDKSTSTNENLIFSKEIEVI
ncbi:ElyC/SanA/YdcF family protein [Bacillus cereus]|nr:ElyC/SanA/YdcF family protein [Bacillus cereus]